jgi:hypothetical protein
LIERSQEDIIPYDPLDPYRGPGLLSLDAHSRDPLG